MTLNLDRSKWRRVTFGDVIESVTDRVDDPSQAGVDRYVGLEHLDPGIMTVQRWDSPDKVEAQKLRFQPGDVIFGRRRAYQKKVALAEFEGICSAHALVLRARQEHILPAFLPVFLSSDYFLNRAISISVGSLSPTVNWRDLRVQEFDLPPLEEQQPFADLMWAVEHHRETVGELEELITSIQSLIFMKHAQQTGIVPLKKWVGRIDAGRSPRAAAEPAAQHEYGVLKVSAVGQNIFRPIENKRLLDTADFRPQDAIKAGDILITRANAVIANVARPCISDMDYDNLMLSDKTLRLVPVPGYPSRLILAALCTPAFRSHVQESVNGTDAKNISQSKILAGPVPDLDQKTVQRVSRDLAALDSTLAALSRRRTTSQLVKASLLAEFFGGN